MAKKNENYLITIDGTQIQDGVSDSVCLSTLGGFSQKDGNYYITYEESAATGFEGNVTTLKVESEERVTMLRLGKNSAQLIIEKGKKHLCHYDTDFGDLVIGVHADKIVNCLHPKGGSLNFRYKLDINASELSVNELNITVQEKKNV